MSQVTFSDVENLKEISDSELEEFIEIQQKNLNIARKDLKSAKDQGYERLYIKALDDDLVALKAEKERRENFREHIDWRDPKEPPKHERMLLVKLIWDDESRESVIPEQARFFVEQGTWWIRRFNATIKPRFWEAKISTGIFRKTTKHRIEVTAWTEIPKGPKGSF